MAQITNVVFDMGGVLLDWNPLGIARAFCPDEDDARLLAGALFGQAAWSWLDAGVVDEATVLWLAQRQLPARLHGLAETMCARWYDGRTWFQETNDCAIRLARTGYKVFLLTNAGPAFERYCERMPAYPYFSGIIVSCQEKLLKPDARIYRLLCDRFGLTPETCLFIDDTRANVEGAERAGMAGLHYTGDASAIDARLAQDDAS